MLRVEQISSQVPEDVMLMTSTWWVLPQALLCRQTIVSSSLSSGLALDLGGLLDQTHCGILVDLMWDKKLVLTFL